MRFDFRPVVALREAQVIVGLQVEPDLRRHAEILAEPQCRIRRDGALAVDDGADAVGRHADGASQPVDADVERQHEILIEDLAGGNGLKQFSGHDSFQFKSTLAV